MPLNTVKIRSLHLSFYALLSLALLFSAYPIGSKPTSTHSHTVSSSYKPEITPLSSARMKSPTPVLHKWLPVTAPHVFFAASFARHGAWTAQILMKHNSSVFLQLRRKILIPIKFTSNFVDILHAVGNYRADSKYFTATA